MWSVFRLLTFDNWDRSAQELMKVSDAASVYAYFIFWIWLGGFIFRNVFTAVLGRQVHGESNSISACNGK